MPPQPPRPALDLLVVGGLTVDRFADGSTAPGGSVLYAARAAAAVVRRVGAVVSAGSEPEAEAGLRELRALKFLHVERVARSISFAHAGDGARRLVFGASGGRFSAPQAPAAAAVLYGPVADELSADLGGQAAAGGTRVAILQGWLRELEAGSAVRPRPLRGMAPQLCATLATLDALVASREDLAAEPGDADRQLDALRETFGARPALVLTDGPNGATLDAAGERWHLPAPARVEHGSTTGAGDMFAALLVAGGWPAAPGRPEVTERAEAAMRSVAEILRRRR